MNFTLYIADLFDMDTHAPLPIYYAVMLGTGAWAPSYGTEFGLN